MRANTWFLRAKVRLSAGRNFANVLKDQKQRQAISSQAAYYIAYACLSDSNQPGTMQVESVEMLVHAKLAAKASKNIRQVTLVGRQADPFDVEHLAAKLILPCRKRPFTSGSHETVARFYAKTMREEPLNGKRRFALPRART